MTTNPTAPQAKCGEGWLCPACSLPAHELTQTPGCGAPQDGGEKLARQIELIRRLVIQSTQERSREPGDAWDQAAEALKELCNRAQSDLAAVRNAALEEGAKVADSWCKADYSEECNIMADSIALEIRALQQKGPSND